MVNILQREPIMPSERQVDPADETGRVGDQQTAGANVERQSIPFRRHGFVRSSGPQSDGRGVNQHPERQAGQKNEHFQNSDVPFAQDP